MVNKIKKYFQTHEAERRALRTFFQTFIGVVAATICDSAGIIDSIEIRRLVVVAVATALAAVMNATPKKEETEDDYS